MCPENHGEPGVWLPAANGAEPQPGRPPRLVYTLIEVGHELLHDTTQTRGHGPVAALHAAGLLLAAIAAAGALAALALSAVRNTALAM
jgi:hypothetical protein